jgi:Zn-dependent protease
MDSSTASKTPSGEHLVILTPKPKPAFTPSPATPPAPESSSPLPPRGSSGSPSDVPKRRSLTRILSGIFFTLGVVLLKLKALLFLAFENARLLFVNPFEGFGVAQYAVAGGSMAVSVWAYAKSNPLGISMGFMLIILIHEIGHALVMRAKGLKPNALVFIPFLGGAVAPEQQPRNAYEDAQIGLAGPLAGTFASLAALQLFKWTGRPDYLTIALLGFAINLINLLPIGMLDGGRISGAITKWMWVLGGAALTYKTFSQPNPLMIIILILAAVQVYISIVREGSKRFYVVSGSQRAAIAIAYFSLVVFLGHQAYMAFQRLGALKH